jgi:hypothetical protein
VLSGKCLMLSLTVFPCMGQAPCSWEQAAICPIRLFSRYQAGVQLFVCRGYDWRNPDDLRFV